MIVIELITLAVLGLSVPLWTQIFPLNPVAAGQISPLALTIIILAVLLNIAGMLLAGPVLRTLSRGAWNHWNFAKAMKKRTPSLPDPSELLLGVPLTPIFNPNRIRAGRLLLGGVDSTAALTSCTALLVCGAALVAAGFTGELAAGTLWLSIAMEIALAGLSAALCASILKIGRSVREQKGKAKINIDEDRQSVDDIQFDAKNSIAALLQLPFVLCVFGFVCALMPLLSIRLDQNPVGGFTAVLYLLMRALLLTFVLALLAHAPRKLMMLSIGKPYLAGWSVAVISTIFFLLWLLLDWLGVAV